MAAKYIEELTPEQLALIPIIRDEWIKIALDTTPIDKQKAEAAIRLAYECAELEPPKEILWFDNPVDAAIYVISIRAWDAVKDDIEVAVTGGIREVVGVTVMETVTYNVRYDVENAVRIAVEEPINPSVWLIICDAVYVAVWNVTFDSVDYTSGDVVRDVEYLALYAYLDAIGVDCSKAKGLFATAKHCGWWWAFKDVAVTIPKPSAIRLDEQGRLHGEGVPAVAYQGFHVYAYHGVRLPEKYGTLHPEKWQSQWLLEEDNAELKRVLIHGIGYERICQELQAIELDSWQEYTLLRIDSNIDIEPIYLLKMTCPSTGHIHALRVPPDMATARDAITWVNWGIAPEEFAVQT